MALARDCSTRHRIAHGYRIVSAAPAPADNKALGFVDRHTRRILRRCRGHRQRCSTQFGQQAQRQRQLVAHQALFGWQLHGVLFQRFGGGEFFAFVVHRQRLALANGAGDLAQRALQVLAGLRDGGVVFALQRGAMRAQCRQIAEQGVGQRQEAKPRIQIAPITAGFAQHVG